MAGTALTVSDARRRDELAEFVGRVVQLDPTATVRLRGSDGVVTAWATTPFEVLATRAVPGGLTPADVAVPAVSLLTALAVERADAVDPGSDAPWRSELPPETGWAEAGRRSAAEWSELVERGLRSAADGPGRGPSAALLDETAVVVPLPSGPAVKIPLRCLVALSGLGLLDPVGSADAVRVAAVGSWLRLDTRGGAVVRRRVAALPLLV